MISSNRNSFNRHIREHLGTDVEFLRNKISEEKSVVAMENGQEISRNLLIGFESFSDEMDTETENNGATTEDINSILQKYKHLDDDEEKMDLYKNVEQVQEETKIKSKDQNVEKVKSAEKKRKFSCDRCQYQATRKDLFMRHTQTVHSEIRYKCTKCHFEAKRTDLLKRHFQSVHEGIKYSCKQCDYQSKRQDRLKTHYDSVHAGIKHPCNQCDYQATRSDGLRKHIKSKH